MCCTKHTTKLGAPSSAHIGWAILAFQLHFALCPSEMPWYKALYDPKVHHVCQWKKKTNNTNKQKQKQNLQTQTQNKSLTMGEQVREEDEDDHAEKRAE